VAGAFEWRVARITTMATTSTETTTIAIVPIDGEVRRPREGLGRRLAPPFVAATCFFFCAVRFVMVTSGVSNGPLSTLPGVRHVGTGRSTREDRVRRVPRNQTS
jgi:hypothetical protein